jgi:hypothetical protein
VPGEATTINEVIKNSRLLLASGVVGLSSVLAGHLV